MPGSTIKVDGLDALKKKFGNIPKVVTVEMDSELSSISKEYEAKAVEAAPKDVGGLAGGITAAKVGEMNHEVSSHAPYSAYIEFGTKRRTQVPADLTAYASQFKGKGRGDYYDFLNAILNWVKRKGIASRYSVKTRKVLKHTKADDERLVETAEAIAFSIIRHGVNPHPYFFPHLPWAQSEVQKRSGDVVKRALEA